ncbi:predicted protein [Fibroporia radiculosa]|uniref:Uncharacterized protein n=1 Tax=Fibroporia radiculosa TaxID=599839 RepID=J4H2T9_9APHY|nr:predicted protein [Fibroporia radiculosa]
MAESELPEDTHAYIKCCG